MYLLLCREKDEVRFILVSDSIVPHCPDSDFPYLLYLQIAALPFHGRYQEGSKGSSTGLEFKKGVGPAGGHH